MTLKNCDLMFQNSYMTIKSDDFLLTDSSRAIIVKLIN